MKTREREDLYMKIVITVMLFMVSINLYFFIIPLRNDVKELRREVEGIRTAIALKYVFGEKGPTLESVGQNMER